MRALPPISENLPVSPESAINISITTQPLPQDPGMFDILPYKVPQNSSAIQPLLTNFLIKLDTSSGSYFYLQVMNSKQTTFLSGLTLNIFQDTITEGTVDLGYCACQAANISFAAVTSAGPSMFSPVSPICIHGGEHRIYPCL